MSQPCDSAVPQDICFLSTSHVSETARVGSWCGNWQKNKLGTKKRKPNLPILLLFVYSSRAHVFKRRPFQDKLLRPVYIFCTLWCWVGCSANSGCSGRPRCCYCCSASRGGAAGPVSSGSWAGSAGSGTACSCCASGCGWSGWSFDWTLSHRPHTRGVSHLSVREKKNKSERPPETQRQPKVSF